MTYNIGWLVILVGYKVVRFDVTFGASMLHKMFMNISFMAILSLLKRSTDFYLFLRNKIEEAFR